MNLASLQLCKELYELSGWGETDFYHNTSTGGDVVVAPAFQSLSITGKPLRERHPAYDLGYLLRKLPGNIGKQYLSINWEGDSWFARYDLIDESDYYQEADTPEDAAAKLCIELFKQGILKREGGGGE